MPHHKRSKFFSLHLKNGSMVEALTCLHASILTNGSLLFVWLIFTIRSLHLTVQLYGSFNASKWGSLFSYQSCLQNHHYSVYSWQFEPDLSFDGWYRHVCPCHHCKKHKTYLQNCHRISMSDKLFTYTVFNYYFSLLSIL